MAIFRTATTLTVLPGREEAYMDWLRACPRVLGGVYARTGITEKVVCRSGRHFIAHFEATSPGALMDAFSQPESLAELSGPLAAIADPGVAPAFFPGELCWDGPGGYAYTHVALRVRLKEGAEAAYMHWVHEVAAKQFDAVWRRHDLARKEVLVNGRDAIAFYRAHDSTSVLKTFGEPESFEAMATNLGPLLELDVSKPLEVYEEAFVWRAKG